MKKFTLARLCAFLMAFALVCGAGFAVGSRSQASPQFTRFTITAMAENSITSITTKEGLLAVAQNPSGNYRLDADIDMAGVDWIPFSFSGNLYGNGHAILNLTYTSVGSESATAYDGNYKQYDTYFGGLFSIIKEGATVSDLKLINVKGTLDSAVPVFMGTVAGFLDGGTVSGCTISGTLNLTTTAKMFGVGGIVGYGRGSITDTDVETTLVCIDEDVADKDEQFLGGAYATGYIDLDNCNVTVYGYDSDHGYVHNGGLTGMYMFYPYGQTHSGKITNCTVDGFITFFEDNTDRRAYCKAYWGELLSTNLMIDGCSDTFESREVYDYSTNLLPDVCGVADGGERYSKVVTESTDTEYGYTTYTCGTCGYTYTDNFTLLAGDLAKIKAEQEKATEQTTAESTVAGNITNEAAGDWTNSQSDVSGVIVIILAVAVLILLLFIVVYGYSVHRRRKHRRRRRR